MAKPKGKKVSIECDHCELICTITFKGRGTIQCCPFCGEEVSVKEDDDRPLLNTIEELDDFNEAKYYDEADREYLDDEDED